MKKIFIKGYIEKAGEKTYRFLASTSAVDRQGDSVDQSGWELKNFMKNAVILWAHRYDELPLGKAIEISITDKGLEVEIQFAEEDANPKAQQVKKLIDEGILNAVSVGFIPKERNGNIITRAELLEISIVPVPANQEALTMAFSSREKDFSLLKKDIEDVLNAETKSGRAISKENRKSLEIAYESLKATVEPLKNSMLEIEKLLALGVATTDEEDTTIEEDDSNSSAPVEEVKRLLRHGNTNISQVLALLKKL